MLALCRVECSRWEASAGDDVDRSYRCSRWGRAVKPFHLVLLRQTPAGAAVVGASECRGSMGRCGWQVVNALEREAIDCHRCHAVMDVRVPEGKSAEHSCRI